MQKFVSSFTTESMHRCALKSWPEESSTEDILALRRLSWRGGGEATAMAAVMATRVATLEVTAARSVAL